MVVLKDIWLESCPYSIVEEEHEDWICNLSKVNIFVGANNTGKSRFLRSLFYRDTKYKFKFFPQTNLIEGYVNKSKKFKEYVFKHQNSIYDTYERQAKFNVYNAIKDIDFIVESETPLPDLVRLFGVNRRKNSNSKNWYDKINEEYFPEITFDENLYKYDFYKIYIPSLRSLIPTSIKSRVNDDNIDIFAERTILDCFDEHSGINVDVSGYLDIPGEPKNAIITGQKFYEYVRNYLLGDLNQRNVIEKYENYLSKTFFNDEKVVLIPKVKDDVLTVKIGKEKERPIHSLGEGIQSIILITLPLFLYLDKSTEQNTNVLVFIEEPEVGLHPELQRTLLNTFFNPIFENYQFFFTTHSNHFIDTTFKGKGISIYSFDKKVGTEDDFPAKFTIQNVGFNHFPTMKRLGALPSSVLMNNCIIMVEGTTDKKHYSLYLDLYQEHLESKKPNFKRFNEGNHYSFLRGGGSEAIETIKDFKDIEKEKIFNIMDNDSPEDTADKKRIFSEIEYENYYILNVKEVENMISIDSVINTLKKVYNIPERSINQDFDEGEYYSNNDFYSFIIEKIFSGKKPDKFPGQKKKGKLKDKLANNEENFVDNFEDLTDEAKNVAIEIYKFVKKNNPNY